MNEVNLSSNTRTVDPLRNAPRICVYDPGTWIRTPDTHLCPFNNIVHIYRDVDSLVNQLEQADINQLFLLLIFHTQSDVDVRRFLMKHIPDQEHIFALYLIFPNGVQYNEKWMYNKSLPKLRWCRSFTNKLIEDIKDVCKSACDQSITFYRQRQREAEDNNQNNTNESSESIVILCETMTKKFAELLKEYLLQT